ncbi:MAG: GtrA family protein [bacterium]
MNRILGRLNKSKCAEKIRAYPVFRKYPTLKQMTKFAITGFISTVLDFLLYIFLTRVFAFWRFHYLWANFIAYIVSVAAIYDWVRGWIFNLPCLPYNEKEALEMSLSPQEEKNIHIQYFKFLFISSFAFIFNNIGLYFFVEFLYMNDILSKAIVGFFVWFFRFNVHKIWTFKSTDQCFK